MCLHDLKWQRETYQKAHYNVTQSIQEKAPAPTKFLHPYSNRQCLVSKTRLSDLRRGEQLHWSRLRLSRSGVKWIIRRQFQSQGREVVLKAWKVASCESGFRWYAYNGSDSGVWQINFVHNVSKEIMFSPELSTAWAWRASDHGRNFSPTWTCATINGIA